MQFQVLLTAQGGLGTGISNLGIAAVIAALACLLCAEVICIGILIRKIIRARKDSYEDPTYRDHYGAAIIGLSAIPQVSFIAITVLAWLTAVGALVFVILLAVCRAKGYDFAVVSKNAEEDEDKPEQGNAPITVPTREEAPVQSYASASVSEETPFAVFDTVEPISYEEEAVEEDGTEETVEEEPAVEEEPIEEEAPAEEPSEEVVEEVPAEEAPAEVLPPIAVTPAPAVVSAASEAPVAADGTQPYKVVEKIVTETYKEIVKETPVPAPAPAESSSAADAVLNKLSDLLDYELQKRKEQDKAEDAAKEEEAKAQDSIPVSASPDADEPEEEDELDEEEDEALDADDPRDEDDVDDDSDGEGDLFTGNERIIGLDEETGCYIVAHYRKSFEAKLIQARPHIKKYYGEIKNALLSYSGTKSRISWACETFSNERQPIVKINVRPRMLELYLALDPASLEGSVYHGKDVGHKKKYADTPFQYKIRTPRKFKWAMELIQQVCEEQGLSPIDIERVDYASQYAFDTTEHLIERGLIREYIRQEKPATSFELDPDHVPDMPEEDGSVIPANANFSWEFDNDAMAEKPIEEADAEETAAEETPVVSAEEPIEAESVEEDKPAQEEQPEEAPAPTVQPVETVRETVKVTEMRYTERYYANGEPVYEQVITSSEPETVIPASLAEANDAEEPIEARADEPVEEISEEAAVEEPVEQDASEQIIVVEPKNVPVAPQPQEEELFFSSDEDETGFSADKFDGADPFADFRGEDEPITQIPEEEEAVEEAPIEDETTEEEPEQEEEPFFEASEEEEPEEIAVVAPVEVEETVYEDEETAEEPLEEEYVEEEYSEEEYAEEAYGEEEYAEEEYTEEEYTEEEYAEEEYAEEAYAEEEYSEEEYAEEYSEEEYYEDEEAYAEEEYADEEYADEEYSEEEYYEEDYTEEPYEAEEYEEDGYGYEEEEEESDAYAEDFIFEESKNPMRNSSEHAPMQSMRPSPSANPSVAIIDICAVEQYYEDGSVVSLASLQDMGLILESATSLKVACSGPLSKQLTIEANLFTESAIRAIHAVGGTIEFIR